MSTQQPKGQYGWGKFVKTGGQTTSPALTTPYSFPLPDADPFNPENVAYPGVANASAGPSVRILGKYTPGVQFTGIPLKASFFTATFLNSIIGGSDAFLDSFKNSDSYAIGLNDGNSTEVWDGSQCEMVSLYANGAVPGIYMDMLWRSQYGNSQKPGGATSVSAPTTDAGLGYDVTQWDLLTNIEVPYEWRLTLMRPQAYQFLGDATRFSGPLQSGGPAGAFSFVTTPLGSTIPSTTQRIKIGTAGTGVQIDANLSLDEKRQRRGPFLGTVRYTYTLGNFTSGGYPWTIGTF